MAVRRFYEISRATSLPTIRDASVWAQMISPVAHSLVHEQLALARPMHRARMWPCGYVRIPDLVSMRTRSPTIEGHAARLRKSSSRSAFEVDGYEQIPRSPVRTIHVPAPFNSTCGDVVTRREDPLNSLFRVSGRCGCVTEERRRQERERAYSNNVSLSRKFIHRIPCCGSQLALGMDR